MRVRNLLTLANWRRDGDPSGFCLLRAIYHCYTVQEGRDIEAVLIEKIYGHKRQNKKRKLGDCLSCWNDTHTFADVHRLACAENI